MKQILGLIIVTIGLLSLIGCDNNTKTAFKDAFDGQYELGVIETTEQKNKSIISLYNKELEKKTAELTTLQIPQVLIQSIEANHDTLIAIGRLFPSPSNPAEAGEGNQISIYNVDTKEIALIELEHDIYQLESKDDMAYILGDPLDADHSDKQDHVYQYRLNGDALKFINKVDVVTTRDDRLHFWVGGIFLK